MERTPTKTLFYCKPYCCQPYCHSVSHLVSQPALRRCFTWLVLILMLCLGSTSLGAQQAPELVLADSRGPMADEILIIGRDLKTGLVGGRANHRYGFRLQDETGTIVAEDFGQTDAVGSIDAFKLWGKTGVQGCRPSKSKGPHHFNNLNFNNLSKASAALDGRIFELSVFDMQKGPVVSVQISLREPEEAIYYWSDAEGNAKCFFKQRERIFLSVFKGELENWDADSRVFMIEKPLKKEDWKIDMPFVDVRKRANCDPKLEACGYPLGSIEELPQTSTVEIEGIAPSEGAFLAIIRPADGLTETVRYLCDRATERAMYIHSMPVDLNDNEDDWDCPPCPP